MSTSDPCVGTVAEIVSRDESGRGMTLIESLFHAYRVEGMLRDQIRSLEARLAKANAEIVWLKEQAKDHVEETPPT